MKPIQQLLSSRRDVYWGGCGQVPGERTIPHPLQPSQGISIPLAGCVSSLPSRLHGWPCDPLATKLVKEEVHEETLECCSSLLRRALSTKAAFLGTVVRLWSSEHSGLPGVTRQQAWKPVHTQWGWGKSWHRESELGFPPVKSDSRPPNGLPMLEQTHKQLLALAYWGFCLLPETVFIDACRDSE